MVPVTVKKLALTFVCRRPRRPRRVPVRIVRVPWQQHPPMDHRLRLRRHLSTQLAELLLEAAPLKLLLLPRVPAFAIHEY